MASGNGLLPYVDRTVAFARRSRIPCCWRRRSGLTLATEACTEATTSDVLGQLQALVLAGAIGSDTELVTLTVGVNDVMWQPVRTGQCTAGEKPSSRAAMPASSRPATCQPRCICRFSRWIPLDRAPSLSERIAGLIGAIRARRPDARIVVTGYPILFGEVAGMCNAGLLDIPALGVKTQLSYGELERGRINQAVMAANGMIAHGVALAGDPNAVYVDVNIVPGGRRLRRTRALRHRRPLDQRPLPADAQPRDRGFHPNAPGQQAYASDPRALRSLGRVPFSAGCGIRSPCPHSLPGRVSPPGLADS